MKNKRTKEEPKNLDYDVVRTPEDALKEKDPEQKRFKRRKWNYQIRNIR